VKRNTVAEVYAQVVKDLQDAEQNCRKAMAFLNEGSSFGNAGKGILAMGDLHECCQGS